MWPESRNVQSAGVQNVAMEILGYLITLAFLRDNPTLLKKLDDFSVNLERVDRLADHVQWEIKHDRGILRDIDEIRDVGYIRKGNVGKYYSNNLRNYIFHGNVSSHEEGAIVTLHFKPEHRPSENVWDGAYDKLMAGNKDTISLLLHRTSKTDEHALHEAINEHLDRLEEGTS
ncbi:hypothetical protein EVAR_62850_1 [Eumeta japonica]|uniref:Uncharacterized protein n=1 Tax=Eumeta variegata TaxID=151549 RepID=A0A4C2A3P1_EUMVA|nr:hypothetical protein EVAR_62850_1 [Eumeta japonica]